MMDVRIACLCPPKDDEPRHDGDTVTLHDKLDFRTAVTMQESVTILRGSRGDDEDIPPAEVLAALDEAYVLYGVASWTLVDAKGKAVPVSPKAVAEHLLTDLAAAMTVFGEAERIYNPVVLAPLVMRGSSSSDSTQATEPTSAEIGSQPEPPKPSKRSSTTTSRTASTARTSSEPAGDSSSSPTLVSVA